MCQLVIMRNTVLTKSAPCKCFFILSVRALCIMQVQVKALGHVPRPPPPDKTHSCLLYVHIENTKMYPLLVPFDRWVEPNGFCKSRLPYWCFSDLHVPPPRHPYDRILNPQLEKIMAFHMLGMMCMIKVFLLLMAYAWIHSCNYMNDHNRVS